MITILTGPAAAGKNTIGHEYATRCCSQCSVIDGDAVRWMLRQPHRAPWDGEESLFQHRLGVKHACLLAKSFVSEGYEVVILDVVWADLAQVYRRELAEFSMKIVRIMPSWEASLDRLHNRPYTITDAQARWVYDTQKELKDFDLDIDNTARSVAEVSTWLDTINHKNP